MNDRWVNCNESYDDRIKLMAKFVTPLSSVLDIGCGQMALKKYLPYKCSYSPCDLVIRSEDTIICDLNKDVSMIKNHYDYIFCSGIFEYVNDVPKLIEQIAPCTNNFVISYACREQHPCEREYHGWVNSYSAIEIIKIFEDEGFSVKIRGFWNTQTILWLERIQ